jgi:hypothetical protein
MAARLGSTKFAAVIEEIVTHTTEADSLALFATMPEQHVQIGEVGAAFMPLSIESLMYHREGGAISVMHYYIQEGDVMMDPMAVITPEGEPLEYQMDGFGGSYFRMEEGVRDDRKKELNAFLDTWSRNLRHIWLPMAMEAAHA